MFSTMRASRAAQRVALVGSGSGSGSRFRSWCRGGRLGLVASGAAAGAAGTAALGATVGSGALGLWPLPPFVPAAK